MLVCQNCHYEQDSGKFCGICGGPLKEATGAEGAVGTDGGGDARANDEVGATVRDDQAPSPGSGESQQHQGVNETGGVQTGSGITPPPAAATQAAGSHDTGESIKNGLTSYWQFIMEMIKNPTKGLQSDDRYLIHALVTVALFAIIFSLSIYSFLNSLVSTYVSPYMSMLGESNSLPFFQINSRLVFYALIVLAITFFISFAIAKLGKNTDSFQVIVSQYGSLFVPLVALNLIALLGGLMGSIGLTVAPLVIAASLAVSYVPILYVFEKSAVADNNGQRVYLAFATFVAISLVFYIFGRSVMIDLLRNIAEMVDQFSTFPF